MADFGRRKCTPCTCMRNRRRDIFRDGEEGRIGAHISKKKEWVGHSEANTAAREVWESRVTPSVRAPVLVLHRSKYSA